MAPPSGNASHPGRHLAVLAAIIVLLLLAIVGADVATPAKWHQAFKVHLGLDLTSGTTVSLRAVPVHGSKVTPAEMQTAQQIMFNRVNSAGFTEAQVVPQGNNIMTVSVPGQNSQKIVQLVSQTAELLFRQVQLIAPNASSAATPVPTPSPTPSGTASGTPSPSASPQGTSSATAKASPKASTSALVTRGKASHNRNAELTSSASLLGAAAHAKASPTPTPSATPASSASATPVATPSPVPTVKSINGTSTWQQASGNPALLSAHVKDLFDKVDCSKKNWAQQIGYGPQVWDNPKAQIVACGLSNGTSGQWLKFVLAPAQVLGSQIKSASATPQTSSTFWQVNLNFNGAGAKAFGALTSQMYSQYGKTSSPLDDLAVVLDGQVVSFPSINQGAILGGSADIFGSFDQTQATNLATVLSYGSLPLTFHQEAEETVTPQLGHDQLNAGLLAGAIGLILVVCYLLFYYRGLAIVAVSSLAIAALLTYLSVIVLGKYQGFALSLAGIAGLIVAIGITADSFVVFFERLRDEVREGGKSLRAAVEHGWGRARRTILVSDTVSFLAAALLYYFAIGDVKGFAFTLGLTTIIDLVVVFTFTKPVMTLLARTKFFGSGHPLSGLDPVRLGARAPWRGTPRTPVRPRSARPATAKEA
ncbi:MAG TPA: protein translocase subunit SecD [Streptosporangiaceae bacterium]|nr:protein translocase subunit SecD [Streptosporangiaceae bacterium]